MESGSRYNVKLTMSANDHMGLHTKGRNVFLLVLAQQCRVKASVSAFVCWRTLGCSGRLLWKSKTISNSIKCEKAD